MSTLYLLTKNEQDHFDHEAIRERGVIPEGTLVAKGSAERFNMPGVNSHRRSSTMTVSVTNVPSGR